MSVLLLCVVLCFFFLHSHLVRLHRCARILWLIMQSKPICAEHIHNTHLPRIVRNGFEVAILRFIHIPKKKSCNSIVAVTHDVLQSVDGVRFFRRFISLSLSFSVFVVFEVSVFHSIISSHSCLIRPTE